MNRVTRENLTSRLMGNGGTGLGISLEGPWLPWGLLTDPVISLTKQDAVDVES